jgi:hypothetical protein
MPSARHSRIGWLLPILLLQFALTGVIGWWSSDPWPSLTFPGFKRVLLSEDRFETTVFRVRVHLPPGPDGTPAPPVELRPDEVFGPVPTSQLSGMLRSRFRKTAGPDTLRPTTVRWLANAIDRRAGRAWERMEIVQTRLVLHRRNGAWVPVEAGPSRALARAERPLNVSPGDAKPASALLLPPSIRRP